MRARLRESSWSNGRTRTLYWLEFRNDMGRRLESGIWTRQLGYSVVAQVLRHGDTIRCSVPYLVP